jgi:hypothetical protein
MSEPDYINETFEQADITPDQLRENPNLIETLIETGMRITHGQANPHILAIELRRRAAG